MPRRATRAPEPPPPGGRALARALRSVPAGGRVLCWNHPPTARWLAAARGDRVHAAGPDPRDLAGIPAGAFLAVFLPGGLPGEPGAGSGVSLPTLARLADRYLVVSSRHPAALFGTRGLPPPLRHDAVEARAAACGFRPLARAARRLLLRPEWVYVFLRDPDSPTVRNVHQERSAAAPARPRT